MKANAEQLSATALTCAWAFKTEKEAKAAARWVRKEEPFIMSMGYTDMDGDEEGDTDEQCEGVDWASGKLTIGTEGAYSVLRFVASPEELTACKETLVRAAREADGPGVMSLWFSPCELEGFDETFDPATGEDLGGECFEFGMKGGTEEPQAPTVDKEAAHLDALQALVDNWLKLGVGPSNGLVEACQYLEVHGRKQGSMPEVEDTCPACQGEKDKDAPCVVCGGTGKLED